MADVTIAGLGAYATPQAGDFIGVWDIALSEYKKVTRSALVGVNVTGGGTIATGGFTLTVPASGTVDLLEVAQTITGQKTFSAAPKVSGSLGDALFSLDSSSANTVLAASEVISLGAFSGLVVFVEMTSGSTAAFLCGSVNVVLIGATLADTWVANDAFASNRLAVYFAEGSYWLRNVFGSSRTVKAMRLRVRDSV